MGVAPPPPPPAVVLTTSRIMDLTMATRGRPRFTLATAREVFGPNGAASPSLDGPGERR